MEEELWQPIVEDKLEQVFALKLVEEKGVVTTCEVWKRVSLKTL